ncbi:MAG TPA: hypothetical protein VLH60_00760 [Sedimentisphaerales bacterium]|nr:hypothetical protein [Sedimentisphaerales bacterium]
MVSLHLLQGSNQMVFESLETVEDSVMKVFFPYFSPELLDRVQLRRVGRELDQTEVARRSQALMPARSVHDHDDSIPRMTSCDFVNEQLHACSVDVGQDQAVEFAVSHRGSRIGIDILL